MHFSFSSDAEQTKIILLMSSLHKSAKNVSSRLTRKYPQLFVRKKRQFIIYKFPYNCSHKYSLFLFPQSISR